jgi:thioredoxin 2
LPEQLGGVHAGARPRAIEGEPVSDTTHPARQAVVKCVFCGQANRVDLTRLAAGPKCGGCGRPIRLDRPLKVGDADFDQTVRGASVPVLVDFYADWCGPCRMMAPAIDELAHTRAGEVLVLKLDTDANPMTATRFGIRGIPTLISFQNGAERGRHVGLADLRVMEGLVGL